MKIKSALSISRLPGLDYALNPYRGCRHGCVYCYSPDVLRLSALELERWGDFAEPKENIPVVLARELKRKAPGVVGIGTVTDPYQPQEERHRITRYCLEQMARRPGWKAAVQTKSGLVTRDIDLLQEIDGSEVGFTITTMDAGLAAKIEPGASTPDARVAALREVSSAGIKAWVFLGPVIPGLNDDHGTIGQIVRITADSGADLVLFDRLRLRPCVESRIAMALGDEFGLVKNKLAGHEWWTGVVETIEGFGVQHGVTVRGAF